MQPTAEALTQGLADVKASPREEGRLEAIVVRPVTNERRLLETCRLDVAEGAVGDKWVRGVRPAPPAGAAELDSQLTLMNARSALLVAGSREAWVLPGDQLIVDLDLSLDHLKPGDHLQVGPVLLEITPKAHNGCRKFAARFGEAALAWVNSPEGKHLRLRGIYARVIRGGDVRVGDWIRKMERGEPPVPKRTGDGR